jgi:hypothetical protein
VTVAELRDSAIWAATCDLKAQVLRNDRRPILARAVVPWLAIAAIGLGTTAFGHPILGWVLVGVGVVPPLLMLLAVRDSGHLILEADGFTYRALAGRALTGGWNACGTFNVVPGSLRAARHVAWTTPDGAHGGAFLPGAGNLAPEDLAVLLNRYRQRFASPDSPATSTSLPGTQANDPPEKDDPEHGHRE